MVAILPILDSLGGVFCALLEMVKARISVKITDYGCQIQNLQDSIEEECPVHTRAIGFAIPEEEEEYEEE